MEGQIRETLRINSHKNTLEDLVIALEYKKLGSDG